MNEVPDDELNNMTMTGGILAALLCSPANMTVEVIHDENGQVTNQLRVTVPFMKSPYILTVERYR